VFQARGDAVELKLKVLDDKLIRAQVSEEEKMKPLHDNVSIATETLYAERLAREVTSPPPLLSPACAKVGCLLWSRRERTVN
jgi:hypothetical protein